MKATITDELSIFLLKKGFTIKCLTGICFDMLARKQGQILLIKVLEDANAISTQYAEEMLKLSSYTGGSPLIVAEKAGVKLQDGVVFSRFDIFTLNVFTFKNAVEQKMPFVFSGKAGLTASIQGAQLKKKREEQGMSLTHLSRKIGVSARMIAKYEHQGAEVTLQKAFKLFDVFGGDVFNRINVFEYGLKVGQRGKSVLSKKYLDLGFDATETKKVPFDIIARKGNEIILTEVGDKHTDQLNSFSRLIDADKLVIFKKKKPKDIPSLTKEEFMDFEKANELITFLKEF